MSETNRPPFDEKLAQTYVGKRVLIGVTFYDADGKPTRQEQMHGEIVFVSTETGIQVKLAGAQEGTMKWFPPNIQSLKFADPGEYRLRQTGEVVVDPDLLWTWNVREHDTSPS